MVTDTEALRAQFEKSISDAATFKVVREGYGYTDRACGWAWEGYQAGHAAAKAEIATAGAPMAMAMRRAK